MFLFLYYIIIMNNNNSNNRQAKQSNNSNNRQARQSNNNSNRQANQSNNSNNRQARQSNNSNNRQAKQSNNSNNRQANQSNNSNSNKKRLFLIILLLILMILFAILIYLNFFSNLSWKDKNAQVVKNVCQKIKDYNFNNPLCTYYIKYIVNDETIELTLEDIKKISNNKNTIPIRYNPRNPREMIIINDEIEKSEEIYNRRRLYNICLYVLIIIIIIVSIIIIKNK